MNRTIVVFLCFAYLTNSCATFEVVPTYDDVLQGESSFSIFNEAIEHAGLNDDLNEGKAVFVPSNTALNLWAEKNNYNQAQLIDSFSVILPYYFSKTWLPYRQSSKVEMDNFFLASHFETGENSFAAIRLSNDIVNNSASIVKRIQCMNGDILEIDSVISPQYLNQLLIGGGSDDLNTMIQLIENSSYSDLLKIGGKSTFLIPHRSGYLFSQYPYSDILKSEYNVENLNEIPSTEIDLIVGHLVLDGLYRLSTSNIDSIWENEHEHYSTLCYPEVLNPSSSNGVYSGLDSLELSLIDNLYGTPAFKFVPSGGGSDPTAVYIVGRKGKGLVITGGPYYAIDGVFYQVLTEGQ